MTKYLNIFSALKLNRKWKCFLEPFKKDYVRSSGHNERNSWEHGNNCKTLFYFKKREERNESRVQEAVINWCTRHVQQEISGNAEKFCIKI